MKATLIVDISHGIVKVFAAHRVQFFTAQDVPARQTAAEGLLVLSRPCEMQFAPNDLLKQGLSTLSFQTQWIYIISIVTSAFQNPQGNMSILASDGGSSRCARCTRGAWAIANCHQATGGTLQGFDQSSYAAEINAVLILLLAIEQCLHLFAHDIIILIDNQDVAQKFEFVQGGHSLHLVISHTSRYNHKAKRNKSICINIYYTYIYIYMYKY